MACDHPVRLNARAWQMHMDGSMHENKLSQCVISGQNVWPDKVMDEPNQTNVLCPLGSQYYSLIRLAGCT